MDFRKLINIVENGEKKPYKVWILDGHNDIERQKEFRTAKNAAKWLNNIILAQDEDDLHPDEDDKVIWIGYRDNNFLELSFVNGLLLGVNNGHEVSGLLNEPVYWSEEENDENHTWPSSDDDESVNESILTEAQNYPQMFVKMINYAKSLQQRDRSLPGDGNLGDIHIPTIETIVKQEIQWAKTNLMNRDRINWFLRLVRLQLCYNLLGENDQVFLTYLRDLKNKNSDTTNINLTV